MDTIQTLASVVGVMSVLVILLMPESRQPAWLVWAGTSLVHAGFAFTDARYAALAWDVATASIAVAAYVRDARRAVK